MFTSAGDLYVYKLRLTCHIKYWRFIGIPISFSVNYLVPGENAPFLETWIRAPLNCCNSTVKIKKTF